VVPGFCTSDADPELFVPIGNAGPAFGWRWLTVSEIVVVVGVPAATPSAR